MKYNTKKIAYQAIDENVEDSTARQMIRYTLECEIFGQDTIQPSNEYIAKKYKWTIGTTKVAIALAKKSKFITTTGRGRRRCLELNVGFLKGKMAEVQQRRPLKTNLLKEIGEELGIEEPNVLPNNLPNVLPNKTDTLDQCQSQKLNYNNNSNNNNIPNKVGISPKNKQSKHKIQDSNTMLEEIKYEPVDEKILTAPQTKWKNKKRAEQGLEPTFKKKTDIENQVEQFMKEYKLNLSIEPVRKSLPAELKQIKNLNKLLTTHNIKYQDYMDWWFERDGGAIGYGFQQFTGAEFVGQYQEGKTNKNNFII